MTPESSVLNLALSAIVALFAIAAVGAVAFLMHRQARRRRTLRSLHRYTDALEHELKECRARLERAHAAMTLGPELPAAGQTEARAAIDTALRELLVHRLWLRDNADDADQRELDTAVSAIGRARESLSQQLEALASAQRALDTAVRERIEDIAQR